MFTAGGHNQQKIGRSSSGRASSEDLNALRLTLAALLISGASESTLTDAIASSGSISVASPEVKLKS
jgi:hypothetical protein